MRYWDPSAGMGQQAVGEQKKLISEGKKKKKKTDERRLGCDMLAFLPGFVPGAIVCVTFADFPSCLHPSLAQEARMHVTCRSTRLGLAVARPQRPGFLLEGKQYARRVLYSGRELGDGR